MSETRSSLADAFGRLNTTMRDAADKFGELAPLLEAAAAGHPYGPTGPRIRATIIRLDQGPDGTYRQTRAP